MTATVRQLDLLDPASPVHLEPIVAPDFSRAATIEERFEAFHSANPHVYTLLVTMARSLKGLGVERTGMKRLFEGLRWDAFVRTRGQEDYRLNNDYTALYARLIMRRERDLDGFFEVRERRRGKD